MIASTHSSSFVLFTRSPGGIRWHHWKQRTNGVDTLFVRRALHEVVRKDSATAMETEGDVDTLFFCRALHKVTEKNSVATREKEDSVGAQYRCNGVLFVLHEVAGEESDSRIRNIG